MNEYNSQSNPIHSVIIPTYNRKDMLLEAIDSVRKQSIKNLEIIVVNDCSTDDTEQAVKNIPDERIKYFRNETNSGQEYSRMIGFRNARGKYISFLDDDDYYTDENFFANAIKFFEEHENQEPPLAFVAANVRHLDVKTGEYDYTYKVYPGSVKGYDFILHSNIYGKPASMFPTVFKADALKRAGFENNRIHDTDTYLYAALFGDLYFFTDVIGTYRIHGESAMRGYKNHKSNFKRFYNKCMEMARFRTDIAQKLYAFADKKEVNRWHTSTVCYLVYAYYTEIGKRTNFWDILKFYAGISKISPKFWLVFPLYRTELFLHEHFRKLTFLRRIYKKIKYGDPYQNETKN